MVKFETFRDSSMVEQVAVNDKVLGSSPSRGALLPIFMIYSRKYIGHGVFIQENPGNN